MSRRAGQLAMGMMLCLLGFLVVVQYQSQSSSAGLNALSVQELGELVANVTTRNNQLRDEIGTLQRQRDSLAASVQRGDSSASQVRTDLDRILGWSGAVPVTGSGVRVTIDGELPGDAVELLLNELRNAGAEALAVGDVRVVPGVVANGAAGSVLVGESPLTDPTVVVAIGQPEALSGSLTRAGGPIARLAARFPQVVIEVETADRVTLPAADRPIAPVLGKPRL
jgi:uncharacterized protein YlxW (UPF0749 family)